MEELNEEQMIKEEGGKMTMTCGIWRASGDWAVLKLPSGAYDVKILRIWRNGKCTELNQYISKRPEYTPLYIRDPFTVRGEVKILSYRLKDNNELAVKRASGSHLTAFKIRYSLAGGRYTDSFVQFE